MTVQIGKRAMTLNEAKKRLLGAIFHVDMLNNHGVDPKDDIVTNTYFRIRNTLNWKDAEKFSRWFNDIIQGNPSKNSLLTNLFATIKQCVGVN